MALLQNSMKQLGMFDREYLYYFSYAFVFFVLYLSCYLLLHMLSSYISIFFVAIFFGLVVVQLAGLMHDAGHKAIFKSDRKNIFCAYLFGLSVGLNPFHWYTKHDLHHKHPNKEGCDPDLKVPFSFTQQHYENPTRMMRWMRSFQDWAYFPLCAGMVYHLHFRFNILEPIQHYTTKTGFLDILWSCVCLSLWYGTPFLLTDPGKALFFILISMSVMGLYASNVFAPNHKAMPQLDKDAVMSELEQQIITTRNVKPSFLNDILYMGLNYQMEHHLFPHCARNKYKAIAPFVRSLTERLGLPYTMDTPFEAYRAILRELSEVRHTCQRH